MKKNKKPRKPFADTAFFEGMVVWYSGNKHMNVIENAMLMFIILFFICLLFLSVFQGYLGTLEYVGLALATSIVLFLIWTIVGACLMMMAHKPDKRFINNQVDTPKC